MPTAVEARAAAAVQSASVDHIVAAYAKVGQPTIGPPRRFSINRPTTTSIVKEVSSTTEDQDHSYLNSAFVDSICPRLRTRTFHDDPRGFDGRMTCLRG